MKLFHDFFCEVFKYNKDECAELNAENYVPGSHYYCKGDTKLSSFCYTAVPLINSICLCTELLIGNEKSLYLKYQVDVDKFCGWEVTGLDSATFNFSISFYYF